MESRGFIVFLLSSVRVVRVRNCKSLVSVFSKLVQVNLIYLMSRFRELMCNDEVIY